MKAPAREAHFRSAIRRSSDMVIPSGYWWPGVRNTPFAAAHIFVPAETDSPCSSTGTGMILAPALAKAIEAPKYPGSSIQTGSSRFKRRRARRSSACCTPEREQPDLRCISRHGTSPNNEQSLRATGDIRVRHISSATMNRNFGRFSALRVPPLRELSSQSAQCWIRTPSTWP